MLALGFEVLRVVFFCSDEGNVWVHIAMNLCVFLEYGRKAVP